MKQHDWTSMRELFSALNKECNYLIMRNYDDILSDDFLIYNKNDIDMLCDNSKLMIKVMDARNTIERAGYTVLVQGQKVRFDLSCVGDREYDALWQKEMLDNRCFNENGFYTMSERDKFYSSAYHYILQKKQLTKEKYEMLLQMAKIMEINAETEADFLAVLQEMMENKGYYFYYPKKQRTICRFELVPAEKCRGKLSWYGRKIKFIPIRAISFIKHRRMKNG